MVNPCSFCRAECCKTYTITVTVFDILRIKKRTGKDPKEFSVFHEPRLLSYDPDMVLSTIDGAGRYLLGMKSHPCVFLDKDNLCDIHDCAPLSCRSYPFQLGGKMNARLCPALSKVVFHFQGRPSGRENLLSELELHKDIVIAWNKNPGKKSECLRFLLGMAAEEGRHRSI